jgi:hypothetical protein
MLRFVLEGSLISVSQLSSIGVHGPFGRGLALSIS